MTDEKIINLDTGKPFELITGGEGQSPEQVVALLRRLLGYALEKNYQAVGIVMVDHEHRSITAYHMEEGMGVALAGSCAHLLHRLNKHMDDE